MPTLCKIIPKGYRLIITCFDAIDDEVFEELADEDLF